MGIVYRARAGDGSYVALKVVRPALAGDEDFRRRFRREATVARQVSHPRVVDVLETGEYEGLPFMAQRYVGMGTLGHKMSGGPMARAEVAVLLTDVGAALEALHELDLIHRDVKPSNILIDDEGHAHITDFGLTKDPKSSLLTQPGKALGTLDYVSPEQIRGVPISPAADVYSLACVAWECLCARPVFADYKGMKVLWAHLRQPPPDPCDHCAGLPVAAGAALLEGLQKDPTRRPEPSVLARRFARGVERGGAG